MNSQPLLDSFRSELSRRGLPWQYIARATAELADHHCDLVDEEGASGQSAAAADERLGDPIRLAEAAAAQYRSRTFAGRHPVLAFVIAPLPLAAALCIGSVLCFILIVFELIDRVAGIEGKSVAEMQPLAIWSLLSLHYLSALAPWALSAMLLSRMAYWSGRGWRWALAGVAIVAVTAACYQSILTLPVEPGGGRYMIGFGISAQLAASQLLQFTVAVLAGVLCMWRLQRRPSPALV